MRKLPVLHIWGVGALLFAVSAAAQNTLDNPDWVEEQAPPPPPYSIQNLLPIDMPLHVTIKVGVDPATVAVGADGIVRYVVVMRNTTGTVTAAYEGIRCVSDEVKTYARVSASGEWSMVANPQWKAVNDNMPSRHAHAIARQGACVARLATSTAEVVKALKQHSQPSKRDWGL